jgi:LacI family transcriptional regulator
VRGTTESRIRGIAERLRYVPHGAARSLITRRTNTVGVLLPELFSEFFSEIIRGIDRLARERGYHLLVSSSHSERSETEAMLRAMRGRVDGLIVLSPDVRLEALRANLPENFPLVLLNSGGNGNGFDAIRIDNSGGAFAMVRHLIGLGHRRIAFVKGPPGNQDALERLRGYRRAMKELSGDWSERLEIPGNFREESGYQSCKSILAMRSRPSAIFAANDSMAIGLLCAFREKGVPVPEDFALAGFDDIPIARFMTPPLSSVRVPIAELGASAARRLVQRLGPAAGSERIRETIATALVVRSSCGAQNARPKDHSNENEAARLDSDAKEDSR